MSDSKQLLIIKSVTRIIETINPTNTDPATGQAYDIDLRGFVLRGVGELGEVDPLPCVTILESPRPIPGTYAEGEEELVQKQPLTLLLQGFVDDAESGTGDGAYALKAQVEQALSRAQLLARGAARGGEFPDDYMLGKGPNGRYLATSFTIGTGGVRPPATGVSPTAFFYLPLVIGYAFNPSNPYE